MIWAFVDYENTGTLDGINYKLYQRVFVFCGPKNSKIKLGNADFSEFISIEIIKLKTMGADNLDFHIAYYLGKYSEIASQDIEFHIISKDNGFNGLVNHIKKMGRKCKKVTIHEKTKKNTKPSPVSLSPCAELTVMRLALIDGRKRPRKKEKLANWIASQCRTVSGDIDPLAVLNELNVSGLIISSGTDVKYQLKR